MASIEISVSKDTYCRNDYPDADISGSAAAMVTSSAGQWRSRIFIEFDISDGPEVATGVYLQVYLKGFNNGDITFARLTEGFTDPITWNNSPSTTSTNSISHSLPTGEEYDWYSFDVTKLYNDAKAAGMGTLGIRWKYDNEYQGNIHQRFIKTKEASGDLGANILVSYDATGRVRGKVYDGDGEPVAGASVNLEGTDVLSGSDGYTPYVDCTCGTDLRTATITPPTGYTCYEGNCTEDYFCEELDKNLNFRLDAPSPASTISSISWSPTGDYTTLSLGAALVESVVGGGTTQLMLVAVDPAAVVDPAIENGEAILQIDQEDPFIVTAGDHFRFNDKEWWALNIICGPECSMITLADEVAQAEKIPKIGDEIQFAASIDWHGQEMSTIKWYYAKAPGECFSDIWDLDWEEFAVGENTNMPAHTFEDEGDEEITFFMVTATNMDFATGTLDTLCGPIFNLWKYMPSWWDQLLEAIRTVNADEIANPILALSENVATMPGWTEPPFTCPICKQVFDGADSEVDYAKHLVAHINAFVENWFEEEE